MARVDKGINIANPFVLAQPSFNFTRDYYETLDELKEVPVSLFPNHFITNVGGVLYQITKTDLNTGEWKLFISSGGDSSNYVTKDQFNELVTTINSNISLNTSNILLLLSDIDAVKDDTSYTAYDSALYKVTINTKGKVSDATQVSADDIYNIGVPQVEAMTETEIEDIFNKAN